jgi:hypothetical protein
MIRHLAGVDGVRISSAPVRALLLFFFLLALDRYGMTAIAENETERH